MIDESIVKAVAKSVDEIFTVGHQKNAAARPIVRDSSISTRLEAIKFAANFPVRQRQSGKPRNSHILPVSPLAIIFVADRGTSSYKQNKKNDRYR